MRMHRNIKMATLLLLLPSLFVFVFFTLIQSRFMSKAEQIHVVPMISPASSGSKDALNLRTFGYATLTPTGAMTLTSSGSSSSSGQPHWPFKDKSPSQFNRIDGGWDLRYKGPTEVLAILPGTVYHQNVLSHANGGGFGPDYAVVKLDTPVSVAVSGKQQTFIAIYYGHVHILPGISGKHVNAGDPIAKTDPNGNPPGVPSNWLEVGFDKGTANPVGGSAAGTPVGFAMCTWLHGAPCPSK